ncbi:3-oxoacyl-ACP reductase FabG [Actinomyces weissii]|uniref:3-oxoacyl-ACP reductase FabG n=1 Tax=Actinomyces weissii TaxID=675090 RepID=A0A7T7MBC5_9ACTO|nr:3-oxoacyl-ACP reductase FabG [Actinomyces weissii]
MLSDEAQAEAEAEAEAGSGGSGPEPGEPDAEAAAFELAPEPELEVGSEPGEPQPAPEPVAEPEEAEETAPEAEPVPESESLAEREAAAFELAPDPVVEAESEQAIASEEEPALEPEVAFDKAEAESGGSKLEVVSGEPDVEAAAFELAPEPAVETDPELDEPEEGPAGEAEPEPVTAPEEAAGTVPESEPALESEALAETQEEAARTTDLQPDSAPETAPELPYAPESEPAPEPKPALEPESDTVPETAPQVPEAAAAAAGAAAAVAAAALPSPRTAPRSRSERPRSVLVTGASRGIGRAVAQAMLEAGEHVVGLSRSGEVPEGALGLATDVTDETSLAEAVARAEAEYGPVEVLVACAGIARDSLAARTSDATWEAMLDTDLTGVFRTVRAVLPQMMRARSGRIVLVSSVVASRGGVGQVAYGAAKAGVEGLVRSLARELAPRGITVNAVAPGFVATDMTSSLPTVVREAHVAATPIGRMATAQEVAAPVVFLASPAASYITGTVLPVDGGLGMGR